MTNTRFFSDGGRCCSKAPESVVSFDSCPSCWLPGSAIHQMQRTLGDRDDTVHAISCPLFHLVISQLCTCFQHLFPFFLGATCWNSWIYPSNYLNKKSQQRMFPIFFGCGKWDTSLHQTLFLQTILTVKCCVRPQNFRDSFYVLVKSHCLLKGQNDIYDCYF